MGVHVYGNKFQLTMLDVIRNGAQSFLNSFPSTIASNNFLKIKEFTSYSVQTHAERLL